MEIDQRCFASLNMTARFGMNSDRFDTDFCGKRAIFKGNTQLSAMDLIKYDRCSLRARYCREIYECFPNG